MSDQEWLDWRRQGITATDVVKIAGLSRYGGPYSVWLDKRGELPDLGDNPKLSFGRYWEAAANRALEDQTGLHVLGEQTWCSHVTERWARATPDGFIAEHPDATIADALGVVEHKSFNIISGDGLLPDVEAQVQWQLYVTGMQHAWVTGLIGRQFVWRLVERDEDDIAWLVSVAKAFRARHIDGDEIPEATAADLEALGALPAASPDEVTTLPAEIVNDVDALREAKEELSAVKARVDALEARIKQALGQASVGTTNTGSPLVTWRMQSRQTIDTKKLEAEYPQIAAACRRVTESRFFRLTPIKSNKEKAA